MSQPRHSSLGLEALGGGLAVAAAAVVGARWLPLDFAYHPNTLGIVSVTTRLGYPTQQETILFLAFGAGGAAAIWAVCGALGRRRFAMGALAAFEALALAAFGASLMLPRGAAALAVAMAGAGLVALAGRADRVAPEAPVAPGPAPSEAGDRTGASSGSAWPLGLAIVGLALVRAPRFVQAVRALGVPDSKLTRNDWVFLSEDGQHLAWADALAHGGFHGRDVFCLYGPLYDWSVVWIWKLFGRSVAAWHLHVGLSEVLAWFGFLSLAALLLRRRWLLLPLALLVPHLSLRIGLPFASLAFLFRHARDGRTADALAAGLLGGMALLYSQEFGAAALACGALIFAIRTRPAAIAAWAGAVALSVAPLLAFYAAGGALGAMLGDLVGYPSLLMAGFGNLPFPSLRATTPWPLWPEGPEARLMREFYFLPAVLVVALGACLPRRAPHPRSPWPWIAQLRADLAARPRTLELVLLALFGLAAFRTALGRSDQMHLYAVAAPPILLLAVGADRLLDRWRERPGGVAFQLALGGALVALGGLATGTAAAGAFHLESAWRTAASFVRGGYVYRGDGSVNRVVAWLEANSEPSDTFYFLPNEAALYYLTDRITPTRFVVSHQMVTDAHRAEALADLRAAPPRYVVWNDAALRLDGIGDEVVLGPALWDWLHAHYAPRDHIGGMRIWEWTGGGAPAPPAPQSR
ncbi:MAG TPA: hypothetical protein VKB65_08540 [Myxococcota bacterium]|nr:hypothetical protein [Myxococcota bacterium]